MAALYDGNGDRIFRLDYRKNPDYVSNKAGTAENVYYPTSSVNTAYDTDVILNEMLIPNGVTQNTAINYELTGYINDINSEYTQTLMEFGANGNTTNIYEYGAQRNSATINGAKGYYLYDGRGSVASLAGNSGGSMITYRYDAYGNTTKSNNTVNNPYQYNAEYTDSSTGLQYLRARYYDSSQGRFTAKDTYLGTIPNPLSRNLYTYVENNPLNFVDPSGHTPMPNPMRNFPHISPMDQMKIDKKIKERATNPVNYINAATNPGGKEAYYDKIAEDVYGEHFYGPSYSNPTGPYRYDPVTNPFGEGHTTGKKEAQTKLQKAIAKRKEENYKKYCEGLAERAKAEASKQKKQNDLDLIQALLNTKEELEQYNKHYIDFVRYSNDFNAAIDAIINALKNGDTTPDFTSNVKVRIEIENNYSTVGDEILGQMMSMIPVLDMLYEVVKLDSKSQNSVSDFKSILETGSIDMLETFLTKSGNELLKALGEGVGHVDGVLSLIDMIKIASDDKSMHTSTRIKIFLQGVDAQSSFYYEQVITKNNKWNTYSGYAGNVIKGNKKYEVIIK